MSEVGVGEVSMESRPMRVHGEWLKGRLSAMGERLTRPVTVGDVVNNDWGVRKKTVIAAGVGIFKQGMMGGMADNGPDVRDFFETSVNNSADLLMKLAEVGQLVGQGKWNEVVDSVKGVGDVWTEGFNQTSAQLPNIVSMGLVGMMLVAEGGVVLATLYEQLKLQKEKLANKVSPMLGVKE